MEKIKLTDNSEYNLTTNGIFANEEVLTAIFLLESHDLTALYEIFSNSAKTKQITLLSSADEPLAIYGNYVNLTSIMLNPDDETPTVTVNLKKADEIALRLASIEEQMTDAQEALCDIYELIIG